MAALAPLLVGLIMLRMGAVAAGGGGGRGAGAVTGSWCVAKSQASDKELQTALDYACGFGADCAPISSNGLCYLPNTLQAHASYAFNSFFQRNARAPGSCDFSGTATVATTDPSYGSCDYPSSPSTAGGITTPGTTPNAPGMTPSTPLTNVPMTPTMPTPFGSSGDGGGLTPGGQTPNMGPSTIPTTNNASASTKFSANKILTAIFLVLSCTLQHMPVF